MYIPPVCCMVVCLLWVARTEDASSASQAVNLDCDAIRPEEQRGLARRGVVSGMATRHQLTCISQDVSRVATMMQIREAVRELDVTMTGQMRTQQGSRRAAYVVPDPRPWM